MLAKIKRLFPAAKFQNNNSNLKKLAILEVEPINFTIRNDNEKQGINVGFQKFLNALDFPIQIIIGTNFINLDTYINALEIKVEELVYKTKKEIYEKHFESYKNHLINTLKDKSVLDRSFFIVIPEKIEIGLSVQIGVIEQQLKALNLKFKRLDNNELTQVLSGFFNDILADTNKLNQDISKENYLHYMIAPKHIKNYPDKITVDDKECRIIYADGYPRTVEIGFLDKIITLNGIFDISIFIEPFSMETMMVMLNRELQKQRADLFAAELKSTINPTLEIQYQDTRAVLENLQKGNEKLFYVSLYINCKAKNQEGLDLITKKVEAELNAMLIVPRRAIFRMKAGLKSTIPLAENELGIKRNITTKALAAFFPFTSQFLQLDNSGVWIGANKNDVPIIKDTFSLSNPNGIILASSGAGKSYWTKLFIIRQLLNSVKVMIIDPQSEYLKLIQTFQGQIVNFSRNSKTVINPLDLLGHDYAEKRLSLMDLFPIMLGNVSEIQKAVLDRALTSTYERKGITNEPKTWKNKPPILGDLLNELEKMSKTATIIEKETYRSLINRLSMFVDGVFSFFNRQTNLNFENQLVGFVIGDMPRQAKPANMFLILDFVYMKMRKDLERKLLVIDEAWSLLARAEDSEYIFEIVKTCRKFNLGLLLITQDVGDLLASRAGSSILQNSAYKLLMRQEAAVIESVVKTFNLSQTEKEKLLTASVGEGILIMDNEHTEIKSIASKEEHQLITTNPDEILKLNEENPTEEENIQDEKHEIDIKVDENKGFHAKRNLNEDEIKFLLGKKYVISSHVPLGGGRQEFYLLKPTTRESNVHFFLVKAIEEYLMQFTKFVKTFETTKPDIVFLAGKKKIAIEIETGITLEKRKDLLEIKIKLLNKNYDDWFFVVAHSDFAYGYSKFGKTFTRKNVCKHIRDYFKNDHRRELSDPKNQAPKMN
ncbi:MAG TPA: ATP-binding protein [Candidatus Nanoarchaeia archaeon]|nr:ATP-binding protein [Candidatus Nanoarchaeia archaeon]